MAQLFKPMQLVDWLDDICVRFIINLPREELESVERIIFQIEEGHWYYEDFIRPLDPTLPSINLKQFCSLIFQHCPLLAGFSHFHAVAYAEFSAYKTRVPVRGAIMLNEDMDQAVLVKGWKKGAKWSFPRGKINKDESDFDCAIREVYEETGYELRTAGIATDPVHSKYIDVTLREQQMRLYVFRGVPLDTYFEPRTRKEISKISWYYITDLPGGKSRKQPGVEDTLKSSQFYMVAPFIGPLKQWVKQQRKRDKMHGGLNAPEPVLVEDSGVGTDMEAMAPELADNDMAEARHFQSLLSRLNQSTSIPQDSELVGDDGSNRTNELAAQLKKLLSVGGSVEPSTTTHQPTHAINPPPPVQGASLMSLLQPSMPSLPPQTPFEQIDTSPQQTRTPHYSHPGLENFDQRGPPPNFPFSPESLNQLYHHQPGGMQFPPGHAPGPVPFQHNHQIPFAPQHHHQGGIQISGQGPHGQNPPHHFVHEAASQPFHPLAGQQPLSHLPMHMSGPPASDLPKPKLSAHSLSLLDAFKSPQPDASQGNMLDQHSQALAFVSPQSQPSVQAHQVSLLQAFGAQPQGAMQAQESRTELEGARVPVSQQKTVQVNTLLDLFRRAPSGNSFSDVGSVERPAELAPPVAELSAVTPQNSKFNKTVTSKPLQVKTLLPPSHMRAGQLTSATVSGPLNAPDFDSVVRNKPPVELGNGQEQSYTPVPVHSVSPGMTLEAPRAMHHPSILDRQTTPANVPTPAPPLATNQDANATGLPASFDRRGMAPLDQKTALMSLFGKQTVQAVAAAVQQQPSFPTTGGVSLNQQWPPSHNSPPVSPLPERRFPSKPQQLPQQYTSQTGQQLLAKSSRVSSFADENVSNVTPRSPITPGEKKNFLFQYLEDVVNKEGKR